MLRFFDSQKGNRKLSLSNFLYTKEKSASDRKTIWRCEKRTCKARLHLSHNDEIVFGPTAHLHAPIHGKYSVAVARSNMNRRARESMETTRQIIQQGLAEVSVENAHLLPSRENVSRVIRHHRQKVQGHQENLNLFLTTISGEPFLRINTARLMLFASPEDLAALFVNGNWFADGTFRVTPQQYEQLYTIHVIDLQGVNRPCAYALMSGKSEEDYVHLLQNLIQLSPPGTVPNTVIVDFELAAINSFRHLFPQCTITGCFFHLGQSIWRHVQREGLSQRYMDDAGFALNVKRLLALAFVPEDRVVAVYERLVNDDAYRDLDVILDYFEDNYIGRQRRGIRVLPRFPKSLWNQHQRVIDNLPRANNCLEAWHCAFNSTVGIAHPTPARLARKLQQEQHATSIAVAQRARGLPPPRKKKRYVAMNRAIVTVVTDYNNRDEMEFLTCVAHVLNINVA